MTTKRKPAAKAEAVQAVKVKATPAKAREARAEQISVAGWKAFTLDELKTICAAIAHAKGLGTTGARWRGGLPVFSSHAVAVEETSKAAARFGFSIADARELLARAKAPAKPVAKAAPKPAPRVKAPAATKGFGIDDESVLAVIRKAKTGAQMGDIRAHFVAAAPGFDRLTPPAQKSPIRRCLRRLEDERRVRKDGAKYFAK